jgi:drug/metabolite transporter (DMT)-like permease
MAVLLALGSSVFYGIADFAGGLLSRRTHFAMVALVGHASGFLLGATIGLFVPAPGLTVADLGWGALSGVGSGLGSVFLYRGLSRGAMSVVVPVSAVGGVALPVLVGVAVLGDRPSLLAWIGIAVAVPALALVSRNDKNGEKATMTGSVDAVVASAGIALQYLALTQATPAAGLWPIVAGRMAAALAIAPMVLSVKAPLRLTWTCGWAAVATGLAAALALTLYMFAARQQLTVIAVVLSSLYPAIPVLLGIGVLRERLGRWQTLGLLGAGAAVALLTLG